MRPASSPTRAGAAVRHSAAGKKIAPETGTGPSGSGAEQPTTERSASPLPAPRSQLALTRTLALPVTGPVLRRAHPPSKSRPSVRLAPPELRASNLPLDADRLIGKSAPFSPDVVHLGQTTRHRDVLD